MKDDKSTTWFIRVTAPWEHIAGKYTTVREWVDHEHSAIGYHIGKKTAKPHCHIAIKLRKELQKQSIDTRFKQLFGVKGSDYSSKIWDGNHKVLSYLYHDPQGKVEVNMKLSEEEIQSIKVTSEVYNEIVTQAKSKSSGKIVDGILEQMGDEDWDQSRIIDTILDGVRAKTWHMPSDYTMCNYVSEIRLRVKDEQSYYRNKSYIRHRILQKLEPRN